MRLLLTAAILAAAMSTPALADTLQEVTTHGMVIVLPAGDIDVVYTPDGKFVAAGGAVTGAWRIDGDKLCTTSSVDPNETCVVYPAGKKSGDSFDVTGPQGPATIRIK